MALFSLHRNRSDLGLELGSDASTDGSHKICPEREAHHQTKIVHQRHTDEIKCRYQRQADVGIGQMLFRTEMPQREAAQRVVEIGGDLRSTPAGRRSRQLCIGLPKTRDATHFDSGWAAIDDL
jgi:hypothetical protein